MNGKNHDGGLHPLDISVPLSCASASHSHFCCAFLFFRLFYRFSEIFARTTRSSSPQDRLQASAPPSTRRFGVDFMASSRSSFPQDRMHSSHQPKTHSRTIFSSHDGDPPLIEPFLHVGGSSSHAPSRPRLRPRHCRRASGDPFGCAASWPVRGSRARDRRGRLLPR